MLGFCAETNNRWSKFIIKLEMFIMQCNVMSIKTSLRLAYDDLFSPIRT